MALITDAVLVTSGRVGFVKTTVRYWYVSNFQLVLTVQDLVFREIRVFEKSVVGQCSEEVEEVEGIERIKGIFHLFDPLAPTPLFYAEKEEAASFDLPVSGAVEPGEEPQRRSLLRAGMTVVWMILLAAGYAWRACSQ